MSQVWCVIGGEDGRAELVASSLIDGGNDVAIPSHDVSNLAMLVARYHDSVLPIELGDAELSTLEGAVDAIEESYGAIDSFAIIVDAQVPAGVIAAGKALAQLRPAASIVLVTGSVTDNDEQRETQRMLNTVFEARLHKVAPAEVMQQRRISVVELSDGIRNFELTA